MELLLPRILGAFALPSLYTLSGEILRSDDQDLILDASKLEFVDPPGCAGSPGKHRLRPPRVDAMAVHDVGRVLIAYGFLPSLRS